MGTELLREHNATVQCPVCGYVHAFYSKSMSPFDPEHRAFFNLHCYNCDFHETVFTYEGREDQAHSAFAVAAREYSNLRVTKKLMEDDRGF